MKPYERTTDSGNDVQFTVEKYDNKVVLAIECRGYPLDAEKKTQSEISVFVRRIET